MRSRERLARGPQWFGGDRRDDADGTELESDYATTDGKGFQWTYRTVDGNEGTVTIGDAEVDLGNGCLFLVANTPGGPRATRLDRALSVGPEPRETLVSLARTDPVVRDFVGIAAL